MDNNQLVSVIVPVYNTDEKYLDECIESVIKQSYENLEIIIVDDGSKASIAAHLDEYAKHDSRIRVCHQENRGQAEARNAGLRKAIGNYIVHVDSDDMLLPTFVERGVDLFSQNNADIVLFDHYRLFGGRLIQSGYNGPKRLEFSSDSMYQMVGTSICERFIKGIYFPYTMCCWGRIFKTESIRKDELFFRKAGPSDDQDYMMRLYPLLKKVVFESEPLYLYRQDNISLTRGIKPNVVEERCSIFDILEKDIDDSNLELREAFDNGRAQYLVNVCTTYLFHPMCKENYFYKRAYMKNALKQRHFREGLSGLKKRYFPLAKYIFLLLLKWNFIDIALFVGWCGARKKYKCNNVLETEN